MSTLIIEPNHPRYPDGARETHLVGSWCRGEPPTLYLRGELPRGPAVSIIGSRKAPQDACAYAAELAALLATAGWCVVSGGAEGIDAAAHRGAMRAGGQTVAVVTGGHDLDPYPRRHDELFRDVVRRGGGLISVEPNGTPRKTYHFLQRNHLMVALTAATIVLSAKSGGGATKAAAAAAKLGRPVFYVPECPWRDTARGGLDALRAGATPLWCADDAVALLAPCAVTTPVDLDDAQLALWRVAGDEPTHIDGLVASAGLGRARAAEALLMLLLDGHLEEGPPGHYRRARAL